MNVMLRSGEMEQICENCIYSEIMSFEEIGGTNTERLICSKKRMMECQVVGIHSYFEQIKGRNK